MRRISLRVFFLLLTVGIVASGIWIQNVRSRRSAVNATLDSGGYFTFESKGQVWRRKHLGEQTVDSVSTGDPVVVAQSMTVVSSGEGWVERLKSTFDPGPEPVRVVLRGSSITDDFLRQHVLPLKDLKELYLLETSVTHDGLRQLRYLRSLESLSRFRDNESSRIRGSYTEEFYYDVEGLDLHAFCEWLADADIGSHKYSIDQDALGEIGIDPAKVIIDCKAKDRVLCEAVQECLAAHNLGCIIEDGDVVITTRERASPYVNNVAELRQLMPNLKSLRMD